MAKTSKPDLIKLFEHLLWVNSPKDWVLKSTFFQGTLFVSMLVPVSKRNEYKKIRRNFKANVIDSRSEDLSGLAVDCIDEMKTELMR